MGTNYYLHKKVDTCAHCGHREEPLHIGKSSAGWCFSLRVHPDIGIMSLSDWTARFSAPGVTIRDEYGRAVLVRDMLETITERSRPGPLEWDARQLAQNCAIPGPNNLARHALRDGVTHGDGTWDYIEYEFS